MILLGLETASDFQGGARCLSLDPAGPMLLPIGAYGTRGQTQLTLNARSHLHGCVSQSGVAPDAINPRGRISKTTTVFAGATGAFPASP